MPISLNLSRTSSSLNGLMMASIFFITSPPSTVPDRTAQAYLSPPHLTPYSRMAKDESLQVLICGLIVANLHDAVKGRQGGWPKAGHGHRRPLSRKVWHVSCQIERR